MVRCVNPRYAPPAPFRSVCYVSVSDIPSGLAAALASRYTIERELGRGGMAVVYLAHDLKHDRKVALKVLQPDVAEGVKAERFLGEIQIAAKLTHPHILGLHDSGEAAGLLYYVMPYVEGESLRDRLTREKQLPVEAALRITRDVASALGYAHSQGVVHRDIKPENILLLHGEGLVADFGIARALSAAGGQGVTEAGLAVGTPAYMSPEQASGAAVDGRSDVYSLGCVAYEMLAGHPPFAGQNTQEVLARHALDPVPSLKAARPDIPEFVERAVRKALAKVPADRWPTPAALLAALRVPSEVPARRRRTLTYAVLGVAILIAGAALGSRTLRKRVPAEQSVAVLPFLNMSGDTANEYFSDGMSEELINALVQVNGLQVPARTSAFAFKGKNVDIREIGRELNVSNVVEGSVRRAGDRVHVTAQLISVTDGYHRWSETFDRQLRLSDVIAVQEEIARAIVNALQVRLASTAGTTLVRSHTSDLQAYDLYLQGQYLWNQRTPWSVKESIRRFEAAIARDPNYAPAYAGLSFAYWVVHQLQLDSIAVDDSAIAREGRAARKAVALDDHLAEGHAALGQALGAAGNSDEALRDDRRAIELNPRYGWAHSVYALNLCARGRDDSAVAEARLAVRLDPLSASIIPAAVLLVTRHYDEALEAARTSARVGPGYRGGQGFLGRVYLATGRVPEAIAELQQALVLGLKQGRGFLGNAYARAGRRREALALLDELERDRRMTRDIRHRRQVVLDIAMIEVGLGQNERAVQTLLSEEHPRYNFQVLRDPAFDPIAHDPRYLGILRKMGVEL